MAQKVFNGFAQSTAVMARLRIRTRMAILEQPGVWVYILNMLRIASTLALFTASLSPQIAEATTPRWAYEAAYDNVEDGGWYRDYNNELADLAWG
ncbi:MAG: hypothetical protein ACPGTU_16050, partial [Myxococcota bacterium]